jgi:type I restriction enzyme S subunit
MRKRTLGATVTPISGEWGSGDGEVKVLRSTNFTNEGHLDYTQIAYRQVEPEKVRKKRLSVGDILIEKSGGSPTQPVGRVVYFESEGEFLTSNFLSALRVHDDEVFSKYLFYWLLAGYSRGLTEPFQNKTTGIINLQLKRFLIEIEVPLPSLEEQKRIAGILDEADLVRKKTQALIDKYDELAQSLFLDMFGDPVTNPKGWLKKELGQLIDKDRPITYGILMPKDDVKPDGVPYVRVMDVSNGKINVQGLRHTTQEIESKYSRSRLIPNDVLLSIRGHVGRVCVVPEELAGANITQDTARLSFKREVLSRFAVALFESSHFQVQMQKYVKGAAVKGINLGDLRKLVILVPPLSQQREFDEAIKLIDNQKSKAAIQLNLAYDGFNALLQKAFKGELT